jgi:hypothetical protein
MLKLKLQKTGNPQIGQFAETNEFYKINQFTAANIKRPSQPGMVVHACDPSTQEAEAGGLQVQGQPELQTETCLKTNKQKQQPNKVR